MTDLEYLFQSLKREPTADEAHDFSEKVGAIMNDGVGEYAAQRMAFNQVYRK